MAKAAAMTGKHLRSVWNKNVAPKTLILSLFHTSPKELGENCKFDQSQFTQLTCMTYGDGF
jgi:hypothetical protein